jgi:hypothetical protein
MGILQVDLVLIFFVFVYRIIAMKSIILVLASLALANAVKFPTGLAPCRKYITIA